MGRKLSSITWVDLKEEMSIAGDPEKIIEIGKDIYALISVRLNFKSIPEIENMQLALEKLLAGLKVLGRMEINRQHPKK